MSVANSDSDDIRSANGKRDSLRLGEPPGLLVFRASRYHPRMRDSKLALFGVIGLNLLGCKTLDEVSIGYADAITSSQLPDAEGWDRVSVAFPSLTDVDPLASPSLARHSVTAAEIEAVSVTGVELEGPDGGCGTPFTRVEVQLVAPELGPTTLATADRAGECLTWTLVSATDLGPWFRQPRVSIVALVDGKPPEAVQSLSLRVNFLIDVADKRIE
jgi:hypothetical protein